MSSTIAYVNAQSAIPAAGRQTTLALWHSDQRVVHIGRIGCIVGVAKRHLATDDQFHAIGVLRVLLLTLLTCGLSLIWAVPAAATPTWSSPIALSDQRNSVSSDPSVAINEGGFAIEAWSEIVAGTSVIRVAQHDASGTWTTFPGNLSLSLPGDACNPFASIDAAGNALVVWSQWEGPGCASGNESILFATRVVGSSAWSLPGVVGPTGSPTMSPTTAVNAAGQLVVAWGISDATMTYIYASVGSPTSGFGGETKLTGVPIAADQLADLTDAIGPNGDAAVQWTDYSDQTTANTEISVHPRGGAFSTTATALTTNSGGASATSGSVAVDAAGDVLSAYITKADQNSIGVFESRTRPDARDVWQPPRTIAVPKAPYVAVSVSVGMDAVGNATAIWLETNYSMNHDPGRLWVATLPASLGEWIGQTPLTDEFGQAPLDLAVAPSGAAVVSWTPDINVQVLYRAPGEAFGALTPVGAGISSSVSLAPSGDAAISFVGESTPTDARVSVLDASPPTLSAITVPASATTGQAVPISAVASDAWSGLAGGQPSWNFGDGAVGAGSSVSHAYAAPGTYTVTVGASDAVGNAATSVARQIVVSNQIVPPKPLTTITTPKVKARWKASRLVGSVSVSGTVGANTTLTISIQPSRGKKASVVSKFAATAPNWTRTLKLPAGLAPGHYDVIVTGNGVQSSQASFVLAAPKSGIVRHSYATGPRQGPPAATLGPASELWAHFVFGTLPRLGQTVTTQWILPNGRKLAANQRPRATRVAAQVKDLSGKSLPAGHWRCIIRAGGTIVAILNVRLR